MPRKKPKQPCHHPAAVVLETRTNYPRASYRHGKQVRRRLHCPDCHNRWTTYTPATQNKRHHRPAKPTNVI